MMRNGKILMMLALALGLAAAVVGYLGLSTVVARTAAGEKANLRDVVVCTADMTFGTKLEPTMLRVVRYPKEAVPSGAYSALDSVVGQTTKVFMSAREPVTAIKLSSRGGGLSMLVHPHMRAASIEVNQVSGVSGFVLPGDRVDVLSTVDPHNSEDAVTRTLLQNVEVLAAGQKTQQQDNKPINVQAVTLLVDPDGAEVLAHADHEGEISLVLRNPEDATHVTVPAVSTHQMMGISVAEPPRPVGKARPVAHTPAVSKREPGKVRIIRNANVTESPAVTDSSAS